MSLSQLAPRIVGVTVFAGLIALAHRYVWARLVRAPSWSPQWTSALTVGIIALGLLVPLAFLGLRFGPRWLNSPVSWVAYSWLGFAFYLLLLVTLADVIRLVVSMSGALPSDPERRTFLARATAAAVGALALGTGVTGLLTVARGFELKRVSVRLKKLPKEASGYRIVQMSDVHVGPTIGKDFVETIVRETNALQPHMVVITGDLVDGTVEQLREHVAPLKDLKARDGVFFVTGNHEYYSGADEWIEHLKTLGIRVLRNERVRIGDAFELAGVDDSSAARMLAGHGEDVPKAALGRDLSLPLVLLAHQPKAVRAAVKAGVALQLSGHVHGGQLFPFNYLVKLDQPLMSGLHDVTGTQVYVSEGTGYWGPPMRVGTRSELTHIELLSDLS